MKFAGDGPRCRPFPASEKAPWTRHAAALALVAAVLLCATQSDAGWLKPGDTGRLAQRQVCAVTLQWLDASRQVTDDQLAELEHDGRLVILQLGTLVVDDAMAVMPPRPAVSRLIVKSGPNHGAKCWVDGPAPKVR